MKIVCQIEDSFPRSVEEVVERRAALKLSRFANLIREVHVAVEDVNGPRGGPDTRCHVRVKLKHAPQVFIEEQALNVREAVFAAFDRAARTVARRADHRVDKSRRSRPEHPAIVRL